MTTVDTGHDGGAPVPYGTVPEPWFFPEQLEVPRVPPDPSDFPEEDPKFYEGSRKPLLGRKWQIVVMSVVVIIVLVALMVSNGKVAKTAGRSSAQLARAPSAVPSTWVRYIDDSTGYVVWHPKAWATNAEGRTAEFDDPGSDTLLRVYRTPGSAPTSAAAIAQSEQSFAATNPNYQRLQIAETTFGGVPAAVWEYEFTDSGIIQHVGEVAFQSRGDGFILTFQTRDADWNTLLPLFNSFKASFRAPTNP